MADQLFKPGEILTQLERICDSPTFERLNHGQRLLRYLVEHAITNPAGDSVKSTVLHADLFQEHRSEIEKQVARRVWRALRDYYSAEGRTDTLVIRKAPGQIGVQFLRMASGVIPELSPRATEDIWNTKAAIEKRTLSACKTAMLYLDRALTEFPNHPRVLAIKALAHLNRAMLGFPPLHELVAADNILQTIRAQGVEIWESCLAEACVSELLRWDWNTARASYERAIALSSGDCRYHPWHVTFLAHQHEATVAVNLLTPFVDRFGHDIPLLRAQLGLLLMIAGLSDRAERLLSSTIELFPKDHYYPYLFLGLVYEANEDYEGASRVMKRAPTLVSESTMFVGFELYMLARTGERDKARDTLRRLVAARSTRFVPASQLGIACIGLDEHDQAVYWLNQSAASEHDPNAPLVNVLPIFRHLYGHKGFHALVENTMGLTLAKKS